MQQPKTKTIRVLMSTIPLSPRRKLKKAPFDGQRAKPRMKKITVPASFKGGPRR